MAKNGADAVGQVDLVQTSASGGAVTFYSLAPLPGTVGSKGAIASTQLSSRLAGGDGWSTEGLLPPSAADAEDPTISGWSENLASTIVVSGEPALAEGAASGPTARNAYVRDNATGAYQLLAANVGNTPVFFADATDGEQRVLFETDEQLPTSNGTPTAGVRNLYEWNETSPPAERLSVAGLVPPSGESSCRPSGPVCEPSAGGAVAGPGGPSLGVLGGSEAFYTQNTISEDGSLIFFTDLETGIIYERKPAVEETLRISGGTEPAYWRAATSSGTFVFYTEGDKLYRFNSATDAREALTAGAEGTGVLGTLGASADGSYVYFVSPEVLASNTREAGSEVEQAVAAADNLYEWHNGEVTFIAGLGEEDSMDWTGQFVNITYPGAGSGEKSSRVAPDGKEVLFSSVRRLTGYDNGSKCERHGNPCYELYLYNTEVAPSAGNPVCVSCNPRSAPAISNALLSTKGEGRVGPLEHNSFMTHNLADAHARVFFETSEALVPTASDNRTNVYEWERAGEGSCTLTSSSYVSRSGGCLNLISTGQSGAGSYFGDADAEGENVFFFTRQSLVGQDQDENEDLYDARVEGGIVAQNPASVAPCAEEATCRGTSEAQATFGVPSSSLLSGTGNLAPPASAVTNAVKKIKCLKGKRLTHGRCVKIKRKAKKKARRSESRVRKAGAMRRGSR